MKLNVILFSLLLTAGVASASSTLQFGNTTTYASNWANGAGANNTTMVWGIVVDSTGNGFQEGNYTGGFTLSGNAATPFQLSTTGGLTDDYLIISPALMTLVGTTPPDSAVEGQNRITAIASMAYPGAMNGGDSYRIIWFDVTALGGQAGAGLKYGMYQPPSANTIPVDGTPAANLTAGFAGADQLKTMGFTLVPEPSTALLGMLGALGLLRRRR